MIQMSPKLVTHSSTVPRTMAGPKISSSLSSPDAKASSTKGMHKRSRTGCYTCRLRRKKCDEGRASCKACIHLGLECNYKRPMWWSVADMRRRQKELIKEQIRQTKLREKAIQQGTMTTSITNTPPGLCHSVPTSDTYSEDLTRTRGGSVDSQLDFGAPVQYATPELYSSGLMGPPQLPHIMPPFGADFSPYAVEHKIESITYDGDREVRRDSTVSSFTQVHAPGHSFGDEQWVQNDFYVSQQFALDDAFDAAAFQYTPELEDVHGTPMFQQGDFLKPLVPLSALAGAVAPTEEYLMEHFVREVTPLMFPVLEADPSTFSARNEVILPALQRNPIYVSCSLAASALHLKTTQNIDDPQIDQDIMQHRGNTVSQLVEALNPDGNQENALQATLALILFQCVVGNPKDELHDISWRTHFDQSAKDLINNFDLPRQMVDGAADALPPFTMMLASWIDIIGATVACRKPVFADAYRTLSMRGATAGLRQLMGCDDRLMFILSEIASLEYSHAEGIIDDVQLCHYITMLGSGISDLERAAGPVESALSADGAVRPAQLAANITHVFRIAARVYLCSLVPEFDRTGAQVVALVDQLAAALDFIPGGDAGFDRSLVWPLVVAGSVSLPGSAFRATFARRCAVLGAGASLGSLGRAQDLLAHVWHVNDDRLAHGDRRGLHWREAMQQRGQDFLLI